MALEAERDAAGQARDDTDAADKTATMREPENGKRSKRRRRFGFPPYGSVQHRGLVWRRPDRMFTITN